MNMKTYASQFELLIGRSEWQTESMVLYLFCAQNAFYNVDMQKFFIEIVRWKVSNRTVLSLKVESTPVAVANLKLKLCILLTLYYFLPTDNVIEIMGPPGLWVANVVACVGGICVVEDLHWSDSVDLMELVEQLQ